MWGRGEWGFAPFFFFFFVIKISYRSFFPYLSFILPSFIKKWGEITYLCPRAAENWHPTERNNVMLLKSGFMFSKLVDVVNDGISQRSPQVNYDSNELPPLHRCLNFKTAWKRGCAIHKHLHS